MPDPSNEELRALQDRAAIGDLVYTYALKVRESDAAACGALFAPDAVFEMYDVDPADRSRTLRKRVEGRDAIVASIAGSAGGALRICPMIHNLTIRIDGDTAEADCTMTAITIPDGGQLFGEYHDRFRHDDGWRFTSRAHSILLFKAAAAA